MSPFIKDYIKKSLLLTAIYIFTTSSLLSYVLQLINPTEYSGFSHTNKVLEIITVLVIALVLETIVLIWLPYKFIDGTSILRHKGIIYIITSGLLFGLSHLYNLNYFIETLYTGLLMSDYVYHNRHNKKVFLEISLIHSAYNLLAIGLNYLIE